MTTAVHTKRYYIVRSIVRAFFATIILPSVILGFFWFIGHPWGAVATAVTLWTIYFIQVRRSLTQD